jgi:hypothetical protein
MKKLLALQLAVIYSLCFLATTNMAYAEAETKKVCIDSVGKDGKPVIDPKTKKPKQDCKTMKVHQKHEGTDVPVKK